MAGIIENFEERVKEQTTLFQNPCESCTHLAGEEKYTELINQLEKILPYPILPCFVLIGSRYLIDNILCSSKLS